MTLWYFVGAENVDDIVVKIYIIIIILHPKE